MHPMASQASLEVKEGRRGSGSEKELWLKTECCRLEGGGRGQEPRKCRPPLKLGKAREQTILQSLQDEQSPGDTLILAQ